MMIPPNTGEQASIQTVARLRNAIANEFETFDLVLDNPQLGSFRLRGRLLYPEDDPTPFDDIRSAFEAEGFTPLLRRENEMTVLYGYPFVVQDRGSGWMINLLLFIATIFTTLFAGMSGDETAAQAFESVTSGSEFMGTVLDNLWRGWPFSLSILLILGAHELGHYFAARYHKVPASLPYFIPFPSIIGTMGAFIAQRGPSKNVRTQFDIGAAGPLAGMVFAIPILIIGLMTSEVGDIPPEGMFEGNSLLYAGIKYSIFGEFLPNATQDVFLNQVAWAGWVGFLVTGLNLIPVGQLDGGRVSQVLFGEEVLRRIFWPIIIGCIALAFFSGSNTWYVWAALLYFFGNRYEKPLDEITTLDPTRRFLAILTMVMFILVFVPVPFQITTGG